MDNLRSQMQALAQGIATSERERKMAVDQSTAQTANMLQAFGRERAAMAKALESGLVVDRVGRSANVCTIRASTCTMREAFRQDQVRMRRSLRRRLAQSTEAVATFVASLRADFAKGRADFAEAHRHMTKMHRAGLVKDRRDRSREVAQLMKDFHVSRGEMAHELAESLAKSTQEIKSQVSGLSRFRASLQKCREDAWPPRQLPNSLLAAQASGAARMPFSALGLGPEEHQKKSSKKR